MAGSDGTASCVSSVLAILIVVTVVVAYPPRFLEILRGLKCTSWISEETELAWPVSPEFLGGVKYSQSIYDSLTFL
ncbi:MAG: hypothetical protein LBF84_01380 [Holosporales bacterium]|nr:hypothetical protein [Holosporales bacterium]